MKKNLFFLTTLFFFIGMLFPAGHLLAQDKKLPEVKLPELEYKPGIKKGWVGQYVYQLIFNDSTGGGKGKDRVYYHVIMNRTNSGYVELASEVRGAVRSNQPDKNNVQRYESWVNSGTKNSWSKHDEIDTVIVPKGEQVSMAITGRLEKYSRYTSGDNWVKGWITNTDLQLDHTTGKFSFAVPFVNYDLEGDETIIDYTFKPEKKDIRNRKENRNHGLTNHASLTVGDWNILEGNFAEGQKEIIIRERIPVKLEPSYNNKNLPAKKGYIDFYLVLKKVG